MLLVVGVVVVVVVVLVLLLLLLLLRGPLCGSADLCALWFWLLKGVIACDITGGDRIFAPRLYRLYRLDRLDRLDRLYRYRLGREIPLTGCNQDHELPCMCMIR